MDESIKLSEAIEIWLETITNKGGDCPCCGRFGKIYRRPINANMALGLIWLVEEWKRTNTWVSFSKQSPRDLVASNQFQTLRWWNLIERPESDTPKKKHSGLWRPTKLGISFAQEETMIPKWVKTYAGEVIVTSEEMVNLKDCLSTHFDYQKIMETVD